MLLSAGVSRANLRAITDLARNAEFLRQPAGIFSPLIFFFSCNMLRYVRFGPIIGGAGLVLAVVEYANKIRPMVPGARPRTQFPFTAAWLLVVLYRMVTSLPWVDA